MENIIIGTKENLNVLISAGKTTVVDFWCQRCKIFLIFIYMRKEFIYCLKDPRDLSVKYVGKSNNPKKRLREHIYESKNKKTKRERWISKLIKLNLLPILEVLKEIDKGDSIIWEPFYIKKFKQEGFDLVNYDELGMGTPGDKIKNKKVLKKLHNKSKTKINQYDYNGEFIKSFNSLREAEKILKINHGNISKCCSGEYKHAGGYIFKKETDKSEVEKLNNINAKPKKVIEFDLQENKIKEYNSISEASKQTGIDSGNISKVCNGKINKTNNRIFKFKTQ